MSMIGKCSDLNGMWVVAPTVKKCICFRVYALRLCTYMYTSIHCSDDV